MTQALYYIVKTLAQLYLLLYLLRFWLPWVRADFRNPISQAILRLTSPLILPVRRLVPSFGRLDTATVLVTFVLECIILLVLLAIVGIGATPSQIVVTGLLQLCIMSLYVFFFSILIRVILSWIAPGQYNPIGELAGSLADPVLRPFRRIIPTMGGIDISPIIAIVLVNAAIMLLTGLQPLRV